MIYSRIVGTGSYLPDNIVTNADLEKVVDKFEDVANEIQGLVLDHA